MIQTSNGLRYDDYLAHSHRPAFDGLRALGFLLVITAHIPVVPFFAVLQGWAAVWIFLVMSGYLIAMLLMREEKRDGDIAFGPFMVKRICRIVPAYAAAIFIYWLACFAIEPLPGDYESFMERLPYFLTFLPEYSSRNGYSIFTHAWTVGIEVKFYLFFPPVLFLLIRNPNGRFAVTAAAVVILTAIGSFIAQAYCALLFGAMLAFLLERPQGYALIAKATRVSPLVPLALTAATAAMLNYIEQFTMIALVATYLTAYVIVQASRVSRVLTWPPLVYLGQRSYGAYLLHFLAIRLGYLVFGNNTIAGGILTAVFCLVVTVPAAALMYSLIELPAIEFGRQWLAARPALER